MLNTISLQDIQRCIVTFPIIDSFGIIIRESDLLSLDYKLITSPVLVYECSSEVIDTDIPVQPQIHTYNGIKLRFNRVHINSNAYFEGGYFIRLVITAKMLGSNYFDGLNLSNLKQVVTYINSTNVIEVNESILLNSIVNDIDICRNYYSNTTDYLNNLQDLARTVKDTKKSQVNLFSDKKDIHNKGLIYGENRQQGNYRNPFIKFYNKSAELLGKSIEFYNLYLLPLVKANKLCITDLRRVEITVKNSAHKQSLSKAGIIKSGSMKTLGNLYDLDTETLQNIFNSHFFKYYDKIKRLDRGIEFTTIDNMLAYFINLSVLRGASELDCLAVIDMGKTPVERSRIKARFKRIYSYVTYSDYMKNVIEKNNKFSDFLDFLNLKEHLTMTD